MKARKVKGLDPRGTLVENAARIIEIRLEELCSFAPAAQDPSRSAVQHDMRIAAKRLRYVLELTGFCFGRPAEAARRRAKELQEVLGELHDCDVMLPRVESHLAEIRAHDAAVVRAHADAASDLDPELSAQAHHRTAFRGLEVLAVHVAARRALLFDRFVSLWEKSESDGVWRSLAQAVDGTMAYAQ
jgi:CHAD domain-containing protein